jgi:hypothetical protein
MRSITPMSPVPNLDPETEQRIGLAIRSVTYQYAPLTWRWHGTELPCLTQFSPE